MADGPPPLPKFDEAEALERFNEEFPPVEIPAEVTEDVDNDWGLDEDGMLDVIQQYWAQREGQ